MAHREAAPLTNLQSAGSKIQTQIPRSARSRAWCRPSTMPPPSSALQRLLKIDHRQLVERGEHHHQQQRERRQLLRAGEQPASAWTIAAPAVPRARPRSRRHADPPERGWPAAATPAAVSDRSDRHAGGDPRQINSAGAGCDRQHPQRRQRRAPDDALQQHRAGQRVQHHGQRHGLTASPSTRAAAPAGDTSAGGRRRRRDHQQPADHFGRATRWPSRSTA